MVDRWEGEQIARSIRERAGLGEHDLAGTRWIARQLLGEHGVTSARTASLGALEHGERGPVIVVRQGLPAPIRDWVIGHELAHLALGTRCDRLRGDDGEALCDYVGAALQMPRAAFVRRLHELGTEMDPWQQLALDFRVTETSAALRAGEVGDRAVAVVCPRRVYARGPEWLAWPSLDELRRIARSGAPGVRTARLRDQVDRTIVETFMHSLS